jgi:nitrilase
MTNIAVVQAAPVLLDKHKTIEAAVAIVATAARQKAELVVFTEAFIPGYPSWVWRLKPGSDWNLSEEIHARLLKNAVNLASDDLEPLYQAARKYKLTIVCGIQERDDQFSQATLYNSVIIIGSDGKLLNRHRKLMPTNHERMVWGFGDGSGLKVVETNAGRIGTLLCWENLMPLARTALYAQGVEVYIAPTYDSGDGWIGSLQHIAREGRCYVIGCGNLLKGSDIPHDFPERSRLFADENEWINPGDSVVIAPGGQIIAGPMRQEEGILYCDIDLDKVAQSKRVFDVVGHYSRPDILKLQVNTQNQSPVEFND